MLVKRTANGLEVEFYDHMGNQYVNCSNVAGETATERWSESLR